MSPWWVVRGLEEQANPGGLDLETAGDKSGDLHRGDTSNMEPARLECLSVLRGLGE